MSTAKESNICSGREIYHIGRIEFGPIGYPVEVVCQSRDRKATKKCVEYKRVGTHLVVKSEVLEIKQSHIRSTGHRVGTSLRSEQCVCSQQPGLLIQPCFCS